MLALILVVVLLAVVATVVVACFWLFEAAEYHDQNAPQRDLHLRRNTTYAQE